MKTKPKKSKPTGPECIITLKNWAGIPKQVFRGVPKSLDVKSPWSIMSLLGTHDKLVIPEIDTEIKVILSRGTESSARFVS